MESQLFVYFVKVELPVLKRGKKDRETQTQRIATNYPLNSLCRWFGKFSVRKAESSTPSTSLTSA
ncbi:MAG: hypothetical protein ACI9FB_002223 [Candidatus Azotimanducaceae bacterium]|jgi:hypothetical protein